MIKINIPFVLDNKKTIMISKHIIELFSVFGLILFFSFKNNLDEPIPIRVQGNVSIKDM